MIDVDAALIRSILDYDPETGIFTWRARRREHFKTDRDFNAWNARFSGREAGYKNDGYIEIGIAHVGRFLAHRLAWLFLTGQWPRCGVDHRDLDRSNNRSSNLREATQSQNCANSRIRSHNTSGRKGVTWSKDKKKWCSQIAYNRKHIHLGYFDEDRLDDASAAYERAAMKIHGQFARLA